jgi:transposase
MARPQQTYSAAQRPEVKKAYRASKDTRERTRLLCLRLRIERAYSSEKIADIADCSDGLVKKVVSDYGRAGLKSVLRGTFGGNRRNLSLAEEVKLLEPFLKQAESGQILVVGDIHKAYEEVLGRSVPPSTIYRILDRHNWRKDMPRPKHPKANLEEQEAYKKNHREN